MHPDAKLLQNFWGRHVESSIKKGWFDLSSNFETSLLDEREEQKSLALVPEPRPDFNGKLLINRQGTIWTVVEGLARGWVSDALFQRVHFREKKIKFFTIRIRLSPVESVSFITNGQPWNEDVGLVRNSAGAVAIYETPRGEAKPILYGVPSEKVMNFYQLDWDKVRNITDAEFNSYQMRVILKMPDGST